MIFQPSIVFLLASVHLVAAGKTPRFNSRSQAELYKESQALLSVNGGAAGPRGIRGIGKHKSSRTIQHISLLNKEQIPEVEHTPKAAVTHVGGRKFQTRIIGGDESDEGEFPYYVDLNGCGAS